MQFFSAHVNEYIQCRAYVDLYCIREIYSTEFFCNAKVTIGLVICFI